MVSCPNCGAGVPLLAIARANLALRRSTLVICPRCDTALEIDGVRRGIVNVVSTLAAMAGRNIAMDRGTPAMVSWVIFLGIAVVLQLLLPPIVYRLQAKPPA